MGKIEIICGPMFSGKTEELLRRLKRLKYSKKPFILFKPKIEDRYSKNNVVSHDKNSMQAVLVSDSDQIVSFCNQNLHIKNIGIDEVQFLDQKDNLKLMNNILKLKKNGYNIIVSGLDMNSQGFPFLGIPYLLAIADDVQKLKSVCLDCGENGSMSHRINKSRELIQLGSENEYKSLCFNCWKKYNS